MNRDMVDGSGRDLSGGLPVLPVLILGFTALAGFFGFLRGLPGGPAFFAGAVAMIFFPGMALYYLAGWRSRGWLLPEKLTVWFVSGLAALSVLGFLGILLGLRLGSVDRIAAFCYLALIVAVITRFVRRKQGGIQLAGCDSLKPFVWPLVVLALAIGLAFATADTARDNDDWFYLAYISDYLEDIPINSYDAFLGPQWAAPARAWYGSWWVSEALFAKVTGLDPITCHQAYLRFVLIPMAVMALFTLAKRIFQTGRTAYLACFLQMVFYLSSAYPTDSAGWGLLSRIEQDKSLAFFVPAMAASAFGLDLLLPSAREKPAGRICLLYVAAVTAAALVHPLGLVWCAVGLVPIGAVEVVRRRDRISGRNLILLVIPLLVFGAILSGSSEEAASVLEERGSGGGRLANAGQPFWDVYLPGERFDFSSGDRMYEVPRDGVIAHPLLVTRFPLAVLGAVLTFVVARRAPADFGARYLVVLTASVVTLSFVPGVAAVTARFINERMLYRLVWLFPWGFTIAMFLLHLGLRLRWSWLIAILLSLAVARGMPQNYLRALRGGRLQGRISPELGEVYQAFRNEPSPKGIVVASPGPSLMLPAAVDAAYPAYVNPAYSTGGEGSRVRSAKELNRLLSSGWLDEVIPVLDDLECRYVLLERTRPLANALRRPHPRFREIFENRTYVLYEIAR